MKDYWKTFADIASTIGQVSSNLNAVICFVVYFSLKLNSEEAMVFDASYLDGLKFGWSRQILRLHSLIDSPSEA